MRSTFAVIAISKLIDDFSALNKNKILNYIFSCQNSNDGAFGLNPFNESHAGATYCALASLKLLGFLDLLPFKSKLIYWLTMK